MKERGWVLGRTGGCESMRGGFREAGEPNALGDEDVGASGGPDSGGWLDSGEEMGAETWSEALCGVIDRPGEAMRSEEADDVPTIAIGEGVRIWPTDGALPFGTTLPIGDVMLSVDGCAEKETFGRSMATGVPWGCVFDERSSPRLAALETPGGGIDPGCSMKRRVSGEGSPNGEEIGSGIAEGRGGASEEGRGMSGRGAIVIGRARPTCGAARSTLLGGGWLARWSSASARWRLPEGLGAGMPEGGTLPGPRPPRSISSLMASICAFFDSAPSTIDTRGGSGALGLRVGMARAPVGTRCWVAGRGSMRGTAFPPPS